MSDPMTNVQIEDVLSSIRRLVAEGDKTRDAQTPVDQAAKPVTPRPTERLVLTEALRISNDDQAPVAPLESDAGPAEMPSSAARESLEATVAELEAAVIAQPDAWEPDGPEEEGAATSTHGAFVLRNVIEDAVEIVFDEDADEVEASADEPIGTFRHFDRDALSQNDTPLRAMDTAVPVADTDVDHQDELIGGDDTDPEIEETLNAFLTDEAILADAGLDESVVRQMIVEVIREELQGALGERITRSVRKMVRREIHRALSTQDVG